MNSTEAKTIQGVISAGLAAVSCYINALLIPVIILIAVMILDYITGMASAWKKSDLSSKKGVAGIFKKVLYFVLVAVGMVVDWLIFCGLETFSAGEAYKFSFGMLVAIWLIINELISILENLGTIGVPVPKFLIKVIKRLKITADNVAESEDNKYD